MIARRNILKGSDPPLPAQLQIWVDGWIERSRWQPQEPVWKYIRINRVAQCGRHDNQHLVVIDGYTLDSEYTLLKIPWYWTLKACFRSRH
jgi:hypothetical protein